VLEYEVDKEILMASRKATRLQMFTPINRQDGPIGTVEVQDDGELVWTIRSIEGGGVLGRLTVPADAVSGLTAERNGVIRLPNGATFHLLSEERAQKLLTEAAMKAEQFSGR
jgi:hypothetical protein